MSGKTDTLPLLLLCGIVLLSPLCAEEMPDDTRKPKRVEEVNILDVYAGIPIIDAGKNEGVLTGDEFSAMSGGEEKKRFRAVVKRTYAHVSELTILTGAEELAEGAALRRLSHAGVEASAYARYTQPSLGDVTIDSDGTEAAAVLSSGMRVTLARGLYSMRPFIAAEYVRGPEIPRTSGYSPVRLYGGGELNWYYRRLRVSPSVGFGSTLDRSQYGGLCQLQFSFLLIGPVRVFLELGGAAWRSVEEDADDEIGPFVALGMSVKG